MTATAALPPFLSGNIGTLDPSGRATVTLDLNGLAAPGLRIWAVAIALDPGPPGGVARVSAPLLLVL